MLHQTRTPKVGIMRFFDRFAVNFERVIRTKIAVFFLRQGLWAFASHQPIDSARLRFALLAESPESGLETHTKER